MLKCKPAPLFSAYHGYRHLFEGKWGEADLYPLESRETDCLIKRLFFPLWKWSQLANSQSLSVSPDNVFSAMATPLQTFPEPFRSLVLGAGMNGGLHTHTQAWACGRRVRLHLVVGVNPDWPYKSSWGGSHTGSLRTKSGWSAAHSSF